MGDYRFKNCTALFRPVKLVLGEVPGQAGWSAALYRRQVVEWETAVAYVLAHVEEKQSLRLQK